MPNPCQEGLEVCPVDQGCTEIVLKDDDGNEQIADLAELRNREGILDPNNASLNIDHSQDVIVGPVTQFYAPVTIYQHVNGHINGRVQTQEDDNKVVVETPVESPTHPQTPPKFPSAESQKKPVYKKIVIGIICLLVVLSIITSLIVTLKGNKGTPDPLINPPQDIDEKFLLDYNDWEGVKTLDGARRLNPPSHYVIISHTVSPKCTNFLSCSARVRNIQAEHMSVLRSPNIGYNFLVGDDGHAYEARGWDIRNFHMDDSIGICLIGDYTKEVPSEILIESLKRLIDLGVSLNKLSRKYKLIAHNQTSATLSPGVEVFKIIKTWPHYDSGIYRGDN